MDLWLQGPPRIPYESKPRRLIPPALGLNSAANNSQSVPMHSVYSGSMGNTHGNSWETSPLSAGRLPGTVTSLPSPQMSAFSLGNSPPMMSSQSKPVFNPDLDDAKYIQPPQEAARVPIPSRYMSHNPAQPSPVPAVHFEDVKVGMGGKRYASTSGLNSELQEPAWTPIPVAYASGNVTWTPQGSASNLGKNQLGTEGRRDYSTYGYDPGPPGSARASNPSFYVPHYVAQTPQAFAAGSGNSEVGMGEVHNAFISGLNPSPQGPTMGPKPFAYTSGSVVRPPQEPAGSIRNSGIGTRGIQEHFAPGYNQGSQESARASNPAPYVPHYVAQTPKAFAAGSGNTEVGMEEIQDAFTSGFNPGLQRPAVGPKQFVYASGNVVRPPQQPAGSIGNIGMGRGQVLVHQGTENFATPLGLGGSSNRRPYTSNIILQPPRCSALSSENTGSSREQMEEHPGTENSPTHPGPGGSSNRRPYTSNNTLRPPRRSALSSENIGSSREQMEVHPGTENSPTHPGPGGSSILRPYTSNNVPQPSRRPALRSEDSGPTRGQIQAEPETEMTRGLQTAANISRRAYSAPKDTRTSRIDSASQVPTNRPTTASPPTHPPTPYPTSLPRETPNLYPNQIRHTTRRIRQQNACGGTPVGAPRRPSGMEGEQNTGLAMETSGPLTDDLGDGNGFGNAGSRRDGYPDPPGPSHPHPTFAPPLGQPGAAYIFYPPNDWIPFAIQQRNLMGSNWNSINTDTSAADDRRFRLLLESKLDTAEPEYFTGESKDAWLPWISSLKRIFKAKPTIYEVPQSRVAYACSFLRGSASSHYDNLVQMEQSRGEDVSALHEWNSFIQEFQVRFGIFNPTIDAQSRLDDIHQEEGEDFAAFIIRFEELAFRTEYNEPALINRLRKAVVPWLDLNISAQPGRPQTLSEWTRRYQDLDAAWNQQIRSRMKVSNDLEPPLDSENDFQLDYVNPPISTMDDFANGELDLTPQDDVQISWDPG